VSSALKLVKEKTTQI